MTTPNEQIEEIIQSALMGSRKPAEEATREIFAGYVLIPRADLPECKITVRDGEHHVDCGSDWGTWNVKHLDRMRDTSLEHIAAFVAATEWHSSTFPRLAKRRDELARELVEDGAYAYRFAEEPLKLAIDRIIELESAA
jgi:hypothetical protein